MHNQAIGNIGEKIACDYLTKKGYLIIDRNYRSKIGEIDIISKLKNKLVFVEVKTKISDEKGKPYEHVTKSKIAKFKRVVQEYLIKFKIDSPIRLDVISIQLCEDQSIQNILHFENITG
jgi:putative endonuclease